MDAAPASPPADFPLTAADGTRLAARAWVAGEPAGVVVVSHGFGEHGQSYRALAERLSAEAGVDVLAFDYRGHGRSEGKRGVVRHYDDLLLDLEAGIAWAARERPGLPLVLLGHSNGALVALKRVVRDDSGLAGLVVSNPSLRLIAHVPAWKKLLGEVLLRVAPGITLDTNLPLDMLTSDPAMIRAIGSDPLRNRRISPHLFFGMLAAGPVLMAAAPSIRLPTLEVLGQADPLIDADAGRAFFDRLGSPDKTLRAYPEMRHEPFNELGREQVEADVARWIAGRVGR